MDTSQRLKTVGIGLGVAAIAMFMIRMNLVRSSFSVYYAGGTEALPTVLAKFHDAGAGNSRYDTGNWETLVFTPGAEDPLTSIDSASNPGVYGQHGSKLWLNLTPDPYLVDVQTGQFLLRPANIAAASPALANGFTVARPDHTEFRGPMHEPTGALAVAASNSLQFVVGLDGSITPWEDFIADHPSGKRPGCKGGSYTVCGGWCAKFVPDNNGGERLTIDDGDPSEPMFNPEFVGRANGCVPTLGSDGPIVVAHATRPGRNLPKDQLTAFGRDGKSAWSVSVASVFGNKSVRSPVFGVAGSTVVAGGDVSHWWYGHTAVAGSVAADGTITATP